MEIGDIVNVTPDGTFCQNVRRLIMRPRVRYVTETTATTIQLGERRMTWYEWFSAMWFVLTHR